MGSVVLLNRLPGLYVSSEIQATVVGGVLMIVHALVIALSYVGPAMVGASFVVRSLSGGATTASYREPPARDPYPLN
ncbi:hypothetical protein [Cellulomonas fimi]|uniref:Uncharacterized protein n=1 Tax=Cellulomonas fimi TaxID=1708 RepID=A0A7Y0M0B0_CELFI|nr:hypothetical protein [Cellulomonas fimi]NMR21246.1 hypothetical protein [Cellulomonas fimi]